MYCPPLVCFTWTAMTFFPDLSAERMAASGMPKRADPAMNPAPHDRCITASTTESSPAGTRRKAIWRNPPSSARLSPAVSLRAENRASVGPLLDLKIKTPAGELVPVFRQFKNPAGQR